MRRRNECPFFRPVLITEEILSPRLLAALGCQTLVDGYAVQPGRNLGLAAKVRNIAIGGDKSLLRGVAGVVLATEHTKAESEDFPLPPSNDFAEGIWVLRYCQFDKLLIRQIYQHQLVLTPFFHENNSSKSTSDANLIALNNLDAKI